MPPSTDDLPGKKPPECRARQGGMRRKPASSPARRARSWPEAGTRTRPRTCSRRASARAALTSMTPATWARYSHQVTDLPEARAVTIRHDRHEVQCACGRAHVADAPPQAAGAPGTVTYGLNFQALARVLAGDAPRPGGRCADILESMSGTRPSDGWVHKLLERAARRVAAANKAIRRRSSWPASSAATRPRCAGPGPKARKKYLQVACTDLLTCYFLGGRDLPSFRNFVYSDLHGTVVVHARGTSTTTPSTASATSFAPSTYSGPGRRRPDLPGRHLARPDRRGPPRPDPRRQPGPRPGPGRRPRRDDREAPDAVAGVTVGLSRVRRVPGAKSKQPPARPPLECLRHREADVLRFLTDTAIPPTSNQAERDLRPSKTQQKISGLWNSARRKPPATGTPSADTPPPPPSTGSPSSPPSATPSPETPGYRLSRPAPELHPETVTHSN